MTDSQPIRLGIQLANAGAAAADIGIATMAAAAEQAGGDGLWVSDHLLDVNTAPLQRPEEAWWLESLTCLATAAAATSTVSIGTNVLVLPQRNVLEVAKVAATLDRLSNGRMLLGVGSGWAQPEFAALGYDFATRGTRTDEMLRVLRSAWTGSPEAFHGAEITVPDGVLLQPTPLQPRGIPLLIGGMTPRALRRVLELGDGWLGLGRVGMYSPQAVAHTLRELRERREDKGIAPFRDAFTVWAAHPTDLRILPREAAAIVEAGFDEVILHGVWEQGLDAALKTITKVRNAIS